jgi:hypothetical protein
MEIYFIFKYWRNIIVKMFTLSHAIYRFNSILVTISIIHSTDLENTFVKFIWKKCVKFICTHKRAKQKANNQSTYWAKQEKKTSIPLFYFKNGTN